MIVAAHRRRQCLRQLRRGLRGRRGRRTGWAQRLLTLDPHRALIGAQGLLRWYLNDTFASFRTLSDQNNAPDVLAVNELEAIVAEYLLRADRAGLLGARRISGGDCGRAAFTCRKISSGTCMHRNRCTACRSAGRGHRAQHLSPLLLSSADGSRLRAEYTTQQYRRFFSESINRALIALHSDPLNSHCWKKISERTRRSLPDRNCLKLFPTKIFEACSIS